MNAFYKGTYSKTEVAAYWKTCQIVEAKKGKLKGSAQTRIDADNQTVYTWKETHGGLKYNLGSKNSGFLGVVSRRLPAGGRPVLEGVLR